MKFVVSTKSGKAYSATSEKPLFVGKKIGDDVKLDVIGLTGFEAKISGGSDKEGFPMENSVSGTARKRILTAGGIGFNPTVKGERKRYSVRGNLISEDISQVNLVVTKTGSVDIDALLGKKEGQVDERSAKEKATGKK
ncbi:MAG: S6e family ribosomal protein [Candidatus ainarchaeum sp.]|nr:S6e family ribosomal protein [Candidatus ainarchaeum sp.]